MVLPTTRNVAPRDVSMDDEIMADGGQTIRIAEHNATKSKMCLRWSDWSSSFTVAAFFPGLILTLCHGFYGSRRRMRACPFDFSRICPRLNFLEKMKLT